MLIRLRHSKSHTRASWYRHSV